MITSTMLHYELLVAYPRTSPLEATRPEKCYAISPHEVNMRRNFPGCLYWEIYEIDESCTHRRLIRRQDVQPERFTRPVWEEFIRARGLKGNLFIVNGLDVYSGAVSETKLLTIAATTPHLTIGWTRGDPMLCMNYPRSELLAYVNPTF